MISCLLLIVLRPKINQSNSIQMSGNRTFTMIKPDAVIAGNSGSIIKMIEEAGRIPIERDSLYHEVPSQPEESSTREHTFIPLPVLA